MVRRHLPGGREVAQSSRSRMRSNSFRGAQVKQLLVESAHGLLSDLDGNSVNPVTLLSATCDAQASFGGWGGPKGGGGGGILI